MSARCASCGAENDDDAQFCGQCGRKLADFQTDPLIGEVIAGRYRVLRALDEGGMSQVYVADQRLGHGSRDVALKILRLDMAKDPGFSERFEREVELLGQLQHPNTVRIFDYGQLPDGQPFMVMELVAGKPLSDVIADEGALAPARVEQIAIQIVSALAEAHDRGIIHRDLKPNNIMLGTAGPQRDFVKLLDFGIARRVHGHELARNLTMRGTILGTPPYMAPEQFEGGTADVRTDVYALGVVLYELYTGELPFWAETPMAWATQHLSAQPKPFEDTAAGSAVPEHSRRAVMRALSKSPDDRPQSVLELLREVTGGADHDTHLTLTRSGQVAMTPSSAPPPMPVREMETPVDAPRRPPTTLVFGGVALVVAGIVAIVAAVAITSGDEESGEALTPTTPVDSGVGSTDAQASPEVAPERSTRGFSSVHHVSNASDAQNALGEADGLAAELRHRGLLTLEVGRDSAFTGDGTPEPDLHVQVLPGSGAFRVDVSPDHHHFETVLPRGSASADIDVDAVPIDRPRFVRLTALSREPVLVDAVEVAHVVESAGHAH